MIVCYRKKHMDVSFSCVCPVIDNEFRHNIVKIVCGSTQLSPRGSTLWSKELTLKCKLKCYVKPMKDQLGVSPSKGGQGTTQGKEKVLLTSVGIEPTTSR